MFDKDGDGNLTFEEMAQSLRALDQNPTEKILADIAANYDTDGSGLYSFDTFTTILSKYSKKVNNAHVIREALRVFDTENDGKCSMTELRHVMVNLGEKQSEAEVDELLHSLEADEEGKIVCEQLVKLLAPN